MEVCVMDVPRERLLGMAVFGGLSVSGLDFLLRESSLVEIPAGAYFFHEGDDATSMFVMESGRASVLKGVAGGERVLKTMKEGECFGEMALLDFHPRSCSVRADEVCRAIEISQQVLLKLYQEDLKQFMIIQMNLGREVSRRLRLADEQLFLLQS